MRRLTVHKSWMLKQRRQRQSVFLYLFFSIAFCSSYSSICQPKLYLKKVGGPFELTYSLKESIRIKLEGEHDFNSGTIQSFTDSSFITMDTEILLDQIACIDIRGKNFSMFSFRSSPGKLMIAGLLLPPVDYINNRVVQSEKNTRIESGILMLSGGLLLSGVALRLLEKKKFKPGKRHKMAILDSNPSSVK